MSRGPWNKCGEIRSKFIKLYATLSYAHETVSRKQRMAQFNAYKKLGVDANNIPSYKVSGEITSDMKVQGKEINQKIINIDAQGKTEEDVKKIAADYIQKNPEAEMILINIKTDRNVGYTVEYYSNKEAAKVAEAEKKIDSYPALLFSKDK